MTEHLLIVWMATMVAAFCALIGRTGQEGAGGGECSRMGGGLRAKIGAAPHNRRADAT
jgi:hypothetical protein